MTIMLAISLLIATIGWTYSAIHTHVYAARERKYKVLWEGMMDAAGQLASEKADLEKENADLFATLREVDVKIGELSSRAQSYAQAVADAVDRASVSLTDHRPDLPDPEKALGEALDSDDPVWVLAETNRDLMPTWELLRGDGIASMQAHRRFSEWATFCANAVSDPHNLASAPSAHRSQLEDAIEALG